MKKHNHDAGKAPVSGNRARCLDVALEPNKMLFIDTDGLDEAIVGTTVIDGMTCAVYDSALMRKSYFDNADPTLCPTEEDRWTYACEMVDNASNLVSGPGVDGLARPVILDLFVGLCVGKEFDE